MDGEGESHYVIEGSLDKEVTSSTYVYYRNASTGTRNSSANCFA